MICGSMLSVTARHGAGTVAEFLARRDAAGTSLVAQADAVSEAAFAMAQRFRAGGKLLAFGNGNAGTDAAHLAVEFMHPVIVGKPAIPAIALTNDIATVTGDGERFDGFLVPIDVCYHLVGRIRLSWKGFNGGEEVRQEMAGFFDRLAQRASGV
jgi:hypothetical protein